MRWQSRGIFDSKLVLITGGSKGLGFAMAAEFGARRANVVILSRHGDELEVASERLRGQGVQVKTQVCDVSGKRTYQDLNSDSKPGQKWWWAIQDLNL